MPAAAFHFRSVCNRYSRCAARKWRDRRFFRHRRKASTSNRQGFRASTPRLANWRNWTISDLHVSPHLLLRRPPRYEHHEATALDTARF
jgi:hypothetical protein